MKAQPHNGKPGQIVVIDLVRFFAAFMVFLVHLAYLTAARRDSFSAVFSKQSIEAPIWPTVTFTGWVGVQIFFVVSGLVIAFSAAGSSPGRFARSRFLRLVPGAWICATISLLVGGWVLGQFDWRGYRHSIGFLPWGPWIDQVYWTLGVEVMFYIGVYCLLKIGKLRWLQGYGTALIWICVAYHAALGVARSQGVWTFLLDDSYWRGRIAELLLLEHGAFFGIGIYAYIASSGQMDAQRRGRFWFHLAVAIAVALLQIHWHGQEESAGLPYDFNPFLPAIIWLVCLLVIWNGVALNRYFTHPAAVSALRTIGLVTYPFYLLHRNIGSALMGWLVREGLNVHAALWISFAALFLLSLAVVKLGEPFLRHMLGALIDRISRLRLRVSPSA